MTKIVRELTEKFEIKPSQAVILYEVYLSKFKGLSVDELYALYIQMCLNENLVGTSFEKLSLVCELLNIELKKRFEDKEAFVKWLVKKYKNQPVFRVNVGDFSYLYECLVGSKKELREAKSPDLLVCLNNFGEFVYSDGAKLREFMGLEFELALIDFMFKNQYRIGAHLNPVLRVAENAKLISFEEAQEAQKKEWARVSNENLHKFGSMLNRAHRSVK